MDAQQALADLTEISSQIKAAVVFDDKGKVAGSTLPDGQGFAGGAAELLAAAEELNSGAAPLTQLEIATGEGSVFVVRQGKVTIAATTGANPTVGLVFYDLKSALRSIEAARPKPKPKPSPPGRKHAGAPAAKKTGAGRKKASSAKKPPPRKKKPDAP
jgi:predicted regulator of Ras-like GTPase activity (Roadblock/LC7/MglB family)